jgi:ectoine hydroxylase-related dioxygenase (phytanoyl-CoA dioxygenase family)
MAGMSNNPLPPTPTERSAYERDGFFWRDGVFSAEEIARLSTVVEAQTFADGYKQGGDTVHSLSLAAAHPDLRALACDPRLVAILVGLLGPDVCLQHSKLAAKPLQAGTGAFSWHQDFAFYPHTCADLLSVMVMLDDACEDNGCMWMVPGSHRLGLLPHYGADGRFTGGCSQPRLWEVPGATVAVTPRAGGISVHHALTLHGSPANRSGRPRRGLVFSYRAAEAQQLADRVFPDTGFVVSGARSGLVRCGEQRFRLPRYGHAEPGQPHLDAWVQVGLLAQQWNQERGLLPCGAAKEAA